MNLLLVEMRRALHRRLVWTLIALAVVASAVAGAIAFFDSTDLDLQMLRLEDQTHPAVMTDWWIPGSGDGALSIAALALALGGLVGGASVVGAEWKAGTVTTVLTWEPRRRALHAARTASAAVLAFVIAVTLEVVFLAAFLPAVLAHGTTDGVDGGWWLALGAAGMRIALMTACSAMIGTALATIGRGTAFAIVVAWVWLAVGESLVRGLKPAWSRLLLGESTTTVLTWSPLDGDQAVLQPWTSALLAAGYVGLLVVAGTLSFTRRDVAS
jgi:hypothetical protein